MQLWTHWERLNLALIPHVTRRTQKETGCGWGQGTLPPGALETQSGPVQVGEGGRLCSGCLLTGQYLRLMICCRYTGSRVTGRLRALSQNSGRQQTARTPSGPRKERRIQHGTSVLHGISHSSPRSPFAFQRDLVNTRKPSHTA